MKRVAGSLLFVLMMLAAPSSASAKWISLSSDHFQFVGDATERDMRAIAARLEQFRDVVGRLFSTELTRAPMPTVVVVFQNDRSFTPVKPLFQGRPVSVAGYFLGSEDLNYIAVNAEQEAMAYGVIFHEYAHQIMANSVGVAPVWVSEGLAEMYETFAMTDGGRSALVGSPSHQNLEILRAGSMMPISSLVAVRRDSPMYNEGDRRGMFYAQSWALVHYLTFNRTHTAQLKTYLQAISTGDLDDGAFARAFGDPTVLDNELRQYVRSLSFPALKLDLAEKAVSGSMSRAVELSDADAAGYIGDLMARQGRTGEARDYLRKALNAAPESARVNAALGVLEMRDQDSDAALPLLEKAAGLAPDDPGIQTAYARVLTRLADRGTSNEDELYARARTVLGHALELDPDNVATVVTLAEVEMASGESPERGLSLMRRAVKASPGREEYVLLLAQAMALTGDYTGATDLLAMVIARGSRPAIRDAAQRALSRTMAARDAAHSLLK